MAEWNNTKARRLGSKSGHYSERALNVKLMFFTLACFIIFHIGITPCGYSSEAFSVEDRLEYRIVFTQEPYRSELHEEKQGNFLLRTTRPDESRIVVLSPDGSLSVLTPEFVSACDPSVSFDSNRILFSGKRSSDKHWNIWEMDVDGENKRRITNDLGDCAEPEYLALSSITPPDFTDKVRWIIFTSNASKTYEEHGTELATSLYVTNLDPIEGRGCVTWRATFNLSSDFSPTVLRDGRVLFTSWQHHGSRYYPLGMFPLLTINWAGTGLNLFYGNHQGATVKTMACEMPDRTLVFVESDGSTYDGSGRLASVSFRRPLNSHEILSKGEERFRNPHPFPDGRLLVSYTPGRDSYGMYLFDLEKGMLGKMIYDDPEWEDVDAVPIFPRPEPMGRITIVEDSRMTGHLQCLNVYDSDEPDAASIKQGDVTRVRFVEGVPISHSERKKLPLIGNGIGLSGPGSTPIGATPFSGMRTRILGEAPVEPDGSFHVELPADTPFYIQVLDKNSMALQTMQGWMWVRRGSRRGCIGCHENKELAPENRVTEALIKAQPPSLTAPPEERRTVDFRRNVMPIILNRCTSCHSGDRPAGGLELTDVPTKYFNRAYENLLTPKPGASPGDEGKYVFVQNARKSMLIHLLYEWEELAGEKRKIPDNPLSNEEMKVFVEWIDLGAQWDNQIGSNEK